MLEDALYWKMLIFQQKAWNLKSSFYDRNISHHHRHILSQSCAACVLTESWSDQLIYYCVYQVPREFCTGSSCCYDISFNNSPFNHILLFGNFTKSSKQHNNLFKWFSDFFRRRALGWGSILDHRDNMHLLVYYRSADKIFVQSE